MVKLTDKELFEGVKNGEEKVIKYLIKIYLPRINRFVFNNMGNQSDAEDVLQETLTIIYDKIGRNGIHIKCQFGTYLLGIAKIVWIKELNKHSKMEITDISPEILEIDSDIESLIEKNDRQRLFIEHFNKLNDECKQLLQLFFNGLKIKEITVKMKFNSDQHTKNKKYICKKYLIESVRTNPKFNEIKNEGLNNISEIPRW